MSTSKRIAELNEHYRFVTINIDRHRWSDVDEHEHETPHSAIDVRLSHVGACDDDVFVTYDDLTLGQAIKRVHRAVYGHKIPDVDGVGSTNTHPGDSQ